MASGGTTEQPRWFGSTSGLAWQHWQGDLAVVHFTDKEARLPGAGRVLVVVVGPMTERVLHVVGQVSELTVTSETNPLGWLRVVEDSPGALMDKLAIGFSETSPFAFGGLDLLTAEPATFRLANCQIEELKLGAVTAIELVDASLCVPGETTLSTVKMSGNSALRGSRWRINELDITAQAHAKLHTADVRSVRLTTGAQLEIADNLNADIVSGTESGASQTEADHAEDGAMFPRVHTSGAGTAHIFHASYLDLTADADGPRETSFVAQQGGHWTEIESTGVTVELLDDVIVRGISGTISIKASGRRVFFEGHETSPVELLAWEAGHGAVVRGCRIEPPPDSLVVLDGLGYVAAFEPVLDDLRRELRSGAISLDNPLHRRWLEALAQTTAHKTGSGATQAMCSWAWYRSRTHETPWRDGWHPRLEGLLLRLYRWVSDGRRPIWPFALWMLATVMVALGAAWNEGLGFNVRQASDWWRALDQVASAAFLPGGWLQLAGNAETALDLHGNMLRISRLFVTIPFILTVLAVARVGRLRMTDGSTV